MKWRANDDITNISLYRFGDSHSADQHDPDCTVGYVEKIGGRVMTTQEKDRIECAIRHIQTAVDVDPWAREIAVDAMERQDAKIILIRNGDEFATCPNCGHDLMYHREGFCEWCGQKYEMLLQEDGG